MADDCDTMPNLYAILNKSRRGGLYRIPRKMNLFSPKYCRFWLILLGTLTFISYRVFAQSSEGTERTDDILRNDSDVKSCLDPKLSPGEVAKCMSYAVIFDAGSTGTRMHVFQFKRSSSNYIVSNRRKLELAQEIYKDTTPGLSSFSQNPSEAVESVGRLLDGAREVIPTHLWSSTPISLKATAGLRLLPEEEADILISQLRIFFASSGFMTNKNSVEIISGEEEGVFGWFTVNYLLRTLDSLSQDYLGVLKAGINSILREKTVVTIDLGGGSTQVTFKPEKRETIESAPIGWVQGTDFHGKTIQLYSHSYLGNGLMAARLGVLKRTGPKGNSLPGQRELFSPCIPAKTTAIWQYNETRFMVK